MYEAVKQGMNAVRGNHGASLIGANFDGASVMMGVTSGVKALLQKDSPAMVEIHCPAHKLELSVLDSAKSIPYIQIFENPSRAYSIFIIFPQSDIVS